MMAGMRAVSMSAGEVVRPRRAAALPEGGVLVDSDARARREAEGARREARPIPPLGLTGGDLCRTLGGPGTLAVQFPVDLGEVLIDGRLHYFVAHLVARTRTWSESSTSGRPPASSTWQWR